MNNRAPAPVREPQEERLLEVAEVAEALNLSLTTIYRLVRSGQLRSHRFGKGKVRPRGYRVPESAITAYLSGSLVSPTQTEVA
ncbi:helix-turn-helix domain-containing protein [Streptomyces lavendulae]|uniref:helix-turn-helix domain-containing protein n=1 Tax=Streptomyces lavendulae TaxID=1914 RepID=UPI0031E76D90